MVLGLENGDRKKARGLAIIEQTADDERSCEDLVPATCFRVKGIDTFAQRIYNLGGPLTISYVAGQRHPLTQSLTSLPLNS
jgi:hypothetical protein